MKKGLVYYNDILAGEIIESKDGDFEFSYLREYLKNEKALPLSFSLPLQEAVYSSQYLSGFFDGLLPEGWILNLATDHWKYHPIRDRFKLLLKTCNDPIGAVSIWEENSKIERALTRIETQVSKKIHNPGKCLYCYEEISQGEFHEKCSKDFFNSPLAPEVHLDEEVLKELSYLNIKDGLTIPGVQKKISLTLNKNQKQSRLTLTHLSGNFILKPMGSIPHIPENEDLILKLARSYGLPTAETTLIYLDNDELALLIKRFDRSEDGSKIHMEDFCQVFDQVTDRKYTGSYHKVVKNLKSYCSQNAPAEQALKLFELIVFSFIVGNSDLHLKNISVLHTDGPVLAPAYDLLSFEIFQEDFKERDNEQMALSINGKKNKLKRKDFDILAEKFEIKEKVRDYVYRKFLLQIDIWEVIISKSFLNERKKSLLKSLIKERVSLF